MTQELFESDVPGLKLAGRGKVRDIYDLGDALMIVATDRLSAFDVVLPTPIPEKGRVLTGLSQFWFERTGHVTRNHLTDRRLEDVVPADDHAVRDDLLHRRVLLRVPPLDEEAPRADAAGDLGDAAGVEDEESVREPAFEELAAPDDVDEFHVARLAPRA